MTLLWNDGELHELIFDETPYKVYMAKITGNSAFKEIPFVREGIRYYSGEGSFNFTCMSPYAHSRYNYLENAEIDESYAIIHYDTLGVVDNVDGSAQLFISEDDLSEWYYNVDSVPNAPESIIINNVSSYIDLIYQNTELSNVHEWQDSGVIPSSKQGIGYLNNGKYIINNTGDLPMPIKIWYDITTATSISIKINDELIELSIPTKELEELKNHYLVVDTYTGTVERYTQDGKQTGKLYNKYLTNYNILHTLPCGMNTLTFDGQIPIMLEYKYLYY